MNVLRTSYDHQLCRPERYWYPLDPSPSRVYVCLHYLLHPGSRRLRSHTDILYVNARPLYEIYGGNKVYVTFHQINTLYGLGIRKPVNRQFNRSHVWQIDNYDLVQLTSDDYAQRIWWVTS